MWDSFQCLQLEPNAFGPAAQPSGAQVVAFVEGFVIVQLFAIDLPEPVAIAALIGAFDGSAGGAPSAAFSAHLSARLGPGHRLTVEPSHGPPAGSENVGEVPGA
jgi:hypothetical protein